MEPENSFIYSKKYTGIGAAGIKFDDFKLPADADRIIGVQVNYVASNAVVATAVYSTDNRFAQGRLLVNDEKNLFVPFYVTTYSKPSARKPGFIPCNFKLVKNSYVSGFIRLTGSLPEDTPFNIFIHLLYTKNENQS